jgi:hypothetical protein
VNTEQSELLIRVEALRSAAITMEAVRDRLPQLASMTDAQRMDIERDFRKAGAILDAATTAMDAVRVQLNEGSLE